MEIGSQLGEVVAWGCQVWNLLQVMISGRRYWDGWPMRGWRIGEAAKPGPSGRPGVDDNPSAEPGCCTRATEPFRLAVANVTSWSASWRGLIAVGADAYCVQEARIPVEDCQAAVADARVRGLSLHPSDAVDGQHLLAFANKAEVRHLRTPLLEGMEPRMRKRMQYAVVHFGRQRALHIIQIYGSAEGGKIAGEFNGSLVLAAVAWIRSLGDVPALVVGDFNMSLASAAIDAPLAMAGWADVFAHAGPTCIPSNGDPSRIDYVLASRPARDLIVGGSIRWDLGLATHAALVLDMCVEAPEETWMRMPVEPLDGPQSGSWGAEKAGATEAVMQTHGPSIRQAIVSGLLDEAWAALEGAMRAWLSRRRGDQEVPDRKYARAEWRAEAPRARGRDGEAQSKAADAALLRVRRLRSFRHAFNGGAMVAMSERMGSLPYPARCILSALAKSDHDNPEWSATWCELGRQPIGSFQSALDRAEQELKEAAQVNRRVRKDAWFKWVTDSLEDGGGKLFRWIRGGAAFAAAMVPDPSAGGDGVLAGGKAWILSLRGGPAAQLRSLSSHWRRLWQRPYSRPVPEEWLAELDALPPFPARTPWTVEHLRDILRRMAKRKAAGLDGWKVAELRLLPDELMELIVQMFEAVEARGAWPAQLCAPEGLLLPKGSNANPGDPMDRRPIWLLPMLYRVWAAGRAQLFARWRASWPDGDGGLGAEELAWELALDLEAAEANGDDICGAALDWRKAFDNVPLCNLGKLLERAGVPEWLRRPLVTAYTAPRRLRVGSAVGEEWLPTSGILPGCALAVFVLSVMIRPWDRKVARVHDSLRRRIYVDDLTFWARGKADDVAPAITESLEVTKRFEDAMGWDLHKGRGKSAQFANTAKVRAWLKARTADIEVRTCVKDLGVIATAGRRVRAPVTVGRMAIAADRMRRVGHIPVPFNRRCHLAAAAGTAAGIYGVACGAPPARELESLRRAARTAVCHGGCRAAPEIVFGVLSPTWRLDPKAVTVIAPIWQAVKAMRGGYLPADTWRTTVNAIEAGRGRAVGPIAAALRGMARLGLGSDIMRWVGVQRTPSGWNPADHTREESLAVLLEAWKKTQWREVAERRRDFAHVAHGVDRWATMRMLSGGVRGCLPLPPDAAGALRTVIAGNVVTERVASHWTASCLCPHCGLEPEDHEHRFWRCPAWENARTQAMQAPGASAALRATLEDGVARTGVLAAQPALVAMAEAAGREDPGLPVEQLAVEAPRTKVWSDGSCVHPLDPILARAAWGLRVDGARGAPAADLAGPVDGVQTAQRAEVTAALAAVRAVSQPIELVTDSRYVVRSLASIAAGTCPAEWRHADIWTQLASHAQQGRIIARWVPAHKTAEEYASKGLREEDRVGNAAADKNCGEAANARLPPPRIVQQRMDCVEALGRAQRVIAFTELAALRANHGNGGVAVPRIKRRWADVRRGVRAARHAHGSAGGSAAANSVSMASKPEGDPPPPMHMLSMSSGTLSCLACRSSAIKARWTALAYGRCPANANGDHWAWRREPHRVVERDGLVVCTRCRGSVPLLRRSAFEGRQCPAWMAVPPVPVLEQVPPGAPQAAPRASDSDWGAWVLGLMGHKVAGGSVRPKGCGRGHANVEGEPVVRQDPPRNDARAVLAGTAWRPHASAQGPSFAACLVCGVTARESKRLQASPCGGWRDRLPPRVSALTMLGDRVVRADGPQVAFFAALAARRGERPRPPE